MEGPVELQEYLDALTFPAFVLDCDDFSTEDANPYPESIQPMAVNKACQDDKMGDMVRKEIKGNNEFRKWLCKPYVEEMSSTRGQDIFESQELEFSCNFVRSTPGFGLGLTPGRYKVITTRATRTQRPPRPLPSPGRVPSWTLAWSRQGPQLDSGPHRQHLEYLLAKDWSTTPMGPLHDWPQSLRTISSYVLNCPFPCAMFWGEDLGIL